MPLCRCRRCSWLSAGELFRPALLLSLPCGYGPSARKPAPGLQRRRLALCPVRSMPATSTGRTSPAEMYCKYRVTGFANSTLASNSWINCRMNGMLIGRVTT